MTANHILSKIENGIGYITLNRPQALNALTLEMIREVTALLVKWESQDDVTCVVFDGAGDRAFCAGGDIKHFYRAGLAYKRGETTLDVAAMFFREEYALNSLIADYTKPTIAYMGGIVMGGGYGIAGNCDIRIATPHTFFAMPEVKIGFFPDVGSAYHLTRVPNNFGAYLGLTGHTINATDMILANLADIYTEMPLSDICVVMADAEHSIESLMALCATLHTKPDQESLYITHKDTIKNAFDGYRLPKMLNALHDNDDDFSRETACTLSTLSPLSILVTAEHLRRSVDQPLNTILKTDMTLAQSFLQGNDMYEGIRAKMIDRDDAPQWEYSTMKSIPDARVQGYFQA